MSKIKVLTVQFDVTHLNLDAIRELMHAVAVQGEEFPVAHGAVQTTCADLLNTSIREVETEDC